MKLKPLLLVKEMVELEELDEREDDEEDEDSAVPVETESYVSLRKRMVRKHEMRMDNLMQENGKLCQEFRRKQVNTFCFFYSTVSWWLH